MRVTLDHKALERLLGGDTELEIELRNCIVQEFANKHLKAIVNHELIANLERALKKFIDEETKKQIGSPGSYYDKAKLTPSLEKAIKEAVQNSYNNIVKDEIKDLDIKIAKRVKEYEEYYLALIDKKIKDSIAKEVDKKVQDKLNAIIAGIK